MRHVPRKGAKGGARFEGAAIYLMLYFNRHMIKTEDKIVACKLNVHFKSAIEHSNMLD